MPRKYLMTPDFKVRHARWKKLYKGVVYRVSCSDLNIPEGAWNAQDSYQASNEWWLAKRAELDSAGTPAAPQPVKKPLTAESLIKDLEGVLDGGLMSIIKEQHEQHKERLLSPMGYNRKPTIGQALDKWFALVANGCEPTSIISLKGYVKRWKVMDDVLTADMPVDVLTANKLEDVFNWYVKLPGEKSSKRKPWMHFKGFVSHLAQKDLIPLPKNINDRLLSFKVVITSKKAPDVPKILSFLGTLPDRFKLYALLAMNTSMNNVDIGMLEPTQVDWQNGILTRKRVKTGNYDSVPLVMYKLWKETLRLLKQEKSDTGNHLLTDRNGKPLYLSAIKDGNAYFYDKIKSRWRDHFKNDKTKKLFTLRQFRFFGTDLLKKTPFRTYRQAFLGHSPGSVLEKSYQSDEDVTAACEYLEDLIFGKGTTNS